MANALCSEEETGREKTKKDTLEMIRVRKIIEKNKISETKKAAKPYKKKSNFKTSWFKRTRKLGPISG